MKFSQRLGITPIEKMIQIESIDGELRKSLWNALDVYYWETYNGRKWEFGERIDYISGSNLENLFRMLWLHYFKEPIDSMPLLYWDSGGLRFLRNYFFEARWFEVYDFIEFVSANGPSNQREEFIKACNFFMERENAGYRFVNGQIMEISSSDELSEIETAIEKSTPFYGVKEHLSSAISLLSDRKNPDYRNSIKESISAVESLCKIVSGNKSATLGVALKILEQKNKIHPALKKAFSSLYGYSSDSDGIRHALTEESVLSKFDARFMLIICSAFINYIIASVPTDL